MNLGNLWTFLKNYPQKQLGALVRFYSVDAQYSEQIDKLLALRSESQEKYKGYTDIRDGGPQGDSFGG